MTNFGFKRLFCSSEPRVENCNLGNLKPLVRIVCVLFWWFHFSFTEIMLSFMGVLYQMLVEIGWYSNNWDLFSKSSTPVMPRKRKDYVRFAVRQYAKEKNSAARASQRKSQPLKWGENLAATNPETNKVPYSNLEEKFLLTILTYDCNEGWKEVWFPSHVYLFFLILCISVGDHLIERFFFPIRNWAFFKHRSTLICNTIP